MRKICLLMLFLSACGSAATPSPPGPAPGGPTGAPPHGGGPTFATPVGSNEIFQPPAAKPALDHTRCGWIGAGDAIGSAAFVAHAGEFQFVHPAWFGLQPDGVSILTVSNADDPTVVAAALAHNVKVTPLIGADDAARIRLMMNDAGNRAAHISALVKLVHDHGYAGLDLDYEHLWTAADRAPFVAFMQALSTAFHAAGYQLSMAIPALDVDHGDNAYDYTALAQACDVVHVMGYDFHWVGGDHLGPVAPLGWIDGTFAHAAQTGLGDRFLLGVANYAIGNGWYTSSRDAASRCTSPPSTTTNHMATCSYSHAAAGRALTCPTAQGDLWFEDVASMEEKIITAEKYGVRGVTYWTIGDELDGYFAMARKHFP